MVEKVVNITVNQKGTEKAIAQTEKLNGSLNKLKSNTKEVSGALKESGNAILDNGGAMGLLNDATGGFAMTVKDAVESTQLFTKGTTLSTAAQKIYTAVVGTTTGALKGLRLAIAATGLGALALAIGFIVSKVNEWSEATEAQIRFQEALNKTLDRTNQLYKDSITLIQDTTKEQVLRAKIAGKSADDIAKIESDAERERYKNYIAERNRLTNLLKDRNLSAENAQKINDQLSANQKEYFKSVQDGRVQDLQDELSSVEAKRQAQKDLLQKQAEDRAKAREEELKKQKEFEESLAKGLIDLQIATNEAQFEQRDLDIENRQRQSDEIAKISAKEQADRDAEVEAEKKREEAISNAKIAIRTNTQGLLLTLFKKGSAIAKGIAVAEVVREQVKSISGAISNLTIANAKAVAASPLTAGQPFVGLNTAATVTGIAFSAATAAKSIKDILSEGKSAGTASPTGGGGGSTPAPSFNIVAGTGTNQIAQGLANQKQPIKAYITSGEVKTAEALDRNIVKEANLG